MGHWTRAKEHHKQIPEQAGTEDRPRERKAGKVPDGTGPYRGWDRLDFVLRRRSAAKAGGAGMILLVGEGNYPGGSLGPTAEAGGWRQGES